MTSANTPGSDDGSPDAPRDALRREVYWAEEATPLGRLDTQEVRDQLHDFAVLMRADEKVAIPRGEPNLASISRWRRNLKLRLFRLFRPISWRYDRLLADHAELTTVLAERVQAAEAETARLRAELDVARSVAGPEGDRAAGGDRGERA